MTIFPESATARRLCVGVGLEIGGSAHNPFGLDTLNVDLYGDMDTVFKLAEIAECGTALPVDIVAPGDDLPLAGSSVDFVVSSHVLEHFTNPIKALLEWDRVVRPCGIILAIVPHRDRTFDSGRERTTLEHLIADYKSSATEPHGDVNGHDHVWITEDIVELVAYMTGEYRPGWRLEEVLDIDDKVGNGFLVAVRT